MLPTKLLRQTSVLVDLPSRLSREGALPTSDLLIYLQILIYISFHSHYSRASWAGFNYQFLLCIAHVQSLISSVLCSWWLLLSVFGLTHERSHLHSVSLGRRNIKLLVTAVVAACKGKWTYKFVLLEFLFVLVIHRLAHLHSWLWRERTRRIAHFINRHHDTIFLQLWEFMNWA